MKKEYANILRYAMRMELDGAEFFRTQGERFRDGTTRALFARLAKIEESHYRYLEQQLQRYEGKEIEGEPLDPEIMREEESTVFEERAQSEHLDTTLIESDTPDITVLRMAYLIERDFAEFYADAVEQVEDPALKDLFTRLAQWEEGHEALFKKEYKRLMKEYMTLPWGG